jgi:oxygen-dependent protoporphyrinogen oxidase
MRGRLIFVAGAALGYVLGARAGRARYEQIKTVSGKVWNSRGVQSQVHHVEDFIADRTPDVAELIGETTKKVVRKATSKGSGSGSANSTGAGSA